MHKHKSLLMFMDYEMTIDMQVCQIHDLTSQQLERMQNPPVTPISQSMFPATVFFF